MKIRIDYKAADGFTLHRDAIMTGHDLREAIKAAAVPSPLLQMFPVSISVTEPVYEITLKLDTGETLHTIKQDTNAAEAIRHALSAWEFDKALTDSDIISEISIDHITIMSWVDGNKRLHAEWVLA
jgi:protoporphyrinogen oxidase